MSLLSRNTGFSLIELMVTMSIMATVSTIAIPSFQHMLTSNKLATTKNSFIAAIQLARHDAVVRNQQVVLCAIKTGVECDGSDGWTSGWMVFEDRNLDRQCQDTDKNGRCDKDGGEILRVNQRNDRQLVIAGNHNVKQRVYFKPNGYSPFSNGRFVFCAEDKKTGLVLSNNGRLRNAQDNEQLACPS